jgi:ABC-type uncharacterized transport system ATPase subunit
MSLELRGITKRFGALVANDSISLKVADGEIHALLGENGAGKSTLMNVVYGLLQPDSGQILVDDKPLKIAGPSDALAAGIGMVHQHFMLVNVFTVAENIMLGNEHVRSFGFLDLDATREEIRRVSTEYGLDVDPDAIIEYLPVGIQQRVEILRALIHHAKVLILDEPTAVLTPQETDELLAIMRNLANAGTAIVFITHKLREVQEAADRITVIRLGKVVGEASPTATQEELATMMVGRVVSLTVEKVPAKIGSVVLAVQNLTVRNASGRDLVSDVSFEIRAGEILAIAGVQGNGQTELAEALIGLQEFVHGSIKVDSQELVGASVHKALQSGVAYIPESREIDGLIGSFSLAENLVLDLHDLPPYAAGIRMFPNKVKEDAKGRIAEFDVRTTGIDALASSLSGGNKQKLVLARELSRTVKLVVASQPTRGLDVGSVEFVHKRIIAERDSGRAVFVSSTELDEVLGLADRIAVMYRGKIIAIVPPNTSRSKLGLLMAGITDSAPEVEAS